MYHQNTEDIAVEMPGGPFDLAAKEATDHQSTGHSDDASTEKYVEDIRASMKLAAIRGDWEGAERLLRKDPNLARVDITENGNTALHLAAIYSRTKFARELVKRISERDVQAKRKDGVTAFCCAAVSGAVDVAEIIRSKCSNVPMSSLMKFPVEGKESPTYMATAIGKKNMVKYIYKKTCAENLLTSEWFSLLLALLRFKMYDLALEILNKDRKVAMEKTEDGKTALHFLSQHRMSDISPIQEAIPESFSTMFAAIPCLPRLKKMSERPSMSKRAMTLAKRLWDEMEKLGPVAAVELIDGDHPVLNLAAKAGNIELITMLTHKYPHLVHSVDSNYRTIFHIAVSERQEDVFCLIHQIGQLKELTTASVDKDGNDLLHLAAKLPPPNRLKVVSGAALQMQRELQWFKGVEKLVQSACPEKQNYKDGHTPRELFSEEHQELFKEAETWMKDTANYSMVVATLITTMAFAAAFTMPGGNQGETGLPLFLNRSWFKVFVVSNTVAMISSTASIMMFLSILISRYLEDDFLVSLPAKLMLGLATLFASIVGTLFTFTSGFFLLFDVEWMRLSRWVVVSASIALIAVFIQQNIRLCVDTFRSMYWSKVMFRPGKHRRY